MTSWVQNQAVVRHMGVRSAKFVYKLDDLNSSLFLTHWEFPVLISPLRMAWA